MLFENILFSSSTLSSKNIRRYPKKCTKNKYVYLSEVVWLMTMKMRLKMKNRSHRYDMNRSWPKRSPKYTKNKMYLIIIVIGIKQHLSNIWSSVHEKVKQHWDWVKKSVAYKKSKYQNLVFNGRVFINEFCYWQDWREELFSLAFAIMECELFLMSYLFFKKEITFNVFMRNGN